MKRPPTSPAPQQGFTLIEVMITVAIVAILASVAYPSYRDYVIRGRLVDATNGLATMRADMERHFQDNRSYATVGAFVTPCARVDATTRTFGQFVVTCNPAAAAATYTLRADGSGQTNGFVFTVNQNDVRSTVAPTGSGWPSGACWLVRKGQTC